MPRAPGSALGDSVFGGCVDVEHPSLAPRSAPFAGEALDSLTDAVGDEVDVAAVARAAHGDVGELALAAVGEDVGSVNRGVALPARRLELWTGYSTTPMP